MRRKTTEMEQRWEVIRYGITKLKNILEGSTEQFSPQECVMLYTTIYNMCMQKPPHDYCQNLYYKYKEAFEEYIIGTVLPSLREKQDEFMLILLVKRWDNHKIMVTWLSRFFCYLDRYFIRRESLPTLNEVGLACFRDMVFKEVKNKARDAVIVLIDKEREGEQINRALVKNVLDIFVEIGMGQMDCYQKDFEAYMLQDTGSYYSRKASNWILEDSCPDYMLKAEECLKKERDRVSHYLHSSSEPKLVEKVQQELLVVHANQLLGKEHSGCHALLRDDKVDDLSRMYRLYHKIPCGLELVAAVFKQHITSEGTVLIQQAEDAASSPAANGVGQEQVLVRKIIDLHDKYMACVNDCFQNHTLFHKAMKEAFEVFCNKTVTGTSSAVLLATFFDSILKTSGGEKLSDEAIQETFEKVEKLLAYIGDEDVFAEFYRGLTRRTKQKTIELEQGLESIQYGITKLKNILEGSTEQFSSEECVMLYTTIYNMCTQKPPHDYCQSLYNKYKEAFEEYISGMVLPSLREKKDEFMLILLVKRWDNHKIMVTWLSRFFHYLDRYFIRWRSLSTLNEVGLACFRDMVFKEVKGKARDAVIVLIDKEREGEQINRALLKNVLDMFVEIGMGQMDCYQKDFEAYMLQDTGSYYSRKASNWILEYSCPDYMLKAEECLKKERDRVSHYLHSSSEPKLVEKVQQELLVVHANQLLEKEHSGCCTLLKRHKV